MPACRSAVCVVSTVSLHLVSTDTPCIYQDAQCRAGHQLHTIELAMLPGRHTVPKAPLPSLSRWPLLWRVTVSLEGAISQVARTGERSDCAAGEGCCTPGSSAVGPALPVKSRYAQASLIACALGCAARRRSLQGHAATVLKHNKHNKIWKTAPAQVA